MSYRLSGKIAVVTGAASGIGLATAKLFAAEGAHVYITGRRKDALEQATRDIGGKVTGVRVNVLSPGATRTPGLVELAGNDPAQQQGLLDYLASRIPLGRVGEPEEIAKAALFLASDDASFVNGAELFADGGQAQV